MILVVGGAGYLGSWVVELLQRRHESVTVYDNLTYANDYYNPYVNFVLGDVTDHDRLYSALHEADSVIWLAAIVGDAACNINPRRAIEINVKAIEFLVKNYNGPITFTSTASVYGQLDGLATEESPLNPLSLYAESKVEAERILAGRAAIFRLGTLHGISRRMRFDLAVNVMTRDAVKRKEITLFGGSQMRPFLSVADAAAVIIHPHPVGIYNLAAENMSINHLAKIVHDHTGAEIVYHESRSERNRDYAMDCGKLDTRVYLHKVDEIIPQIVWMLGCIKDPYADMYVNSKALPRMVT